MVVDWEPGIITSARLMADIVRDAENAALDRALAAIERAEENYYGLDDDGRQCDPSVDVYLDAVRALKHSN